MMTAKKNPIQRRKAMKLLKEIRSILQDIIDSSLRRLEETIRILDESQRKPGNTPH
jgi:hypothetical protein